MDEDTPQDLVHDLVTEAVFGVARARSPGDRAADVISSGPRARVRQLPPRHVRGRNIVVAAAGNVEHERARGAARSGARTASEGAERRGGRCSSSAAARGPLPAQGHRAVPRLPGGPRHRARRPAALRRLAAGRILGGSASSRLFQEIREKRGMAYSVYTLRLAVRGRPGRSASTSARARRTSPSASRSPPRRSPTSPTGNLRRRRAGAREGEPEGTDHARDGVDLEPDEPARQVAHHRHGAPLASRGSAARSTR